MRREESELFISQMIKGEEGYNDDKLSKFLEGLFKFLSTYLFEIQSC